MAEVTRCNVDDCVWNSDGACNADEVEIEYVLNAAGFNPHCISYEES